MSETELLDHYLQNTMPAEEKLLMEARLLLDQDLNEKARWQKQVYQLVQHYSRKQLKAEVQAVEAKLFHEKRFGDFRKKIYSIFKV